jgi:hypothetical protein
MTLQNNYTLGRGEIHFGKFGAGTQISVGERYLGNTPSLAFTIQTQSLDHFSADRGVKEKDDSVPLSTTRTGALTCDNIDPANLAYFFFGSEDALSITGATVNNEDILGDGTSGVLQGYWYQLGVDDDLPQGQSNLTAYTSPTIPVIVTDDTPISPVAFDMDDDWTVDLATGRLYIVPGGAITDGTNLKVSYKTTTQSKARVISGSTPIEGSLRFLARNPVGTQLDYYMPWVKITPNGDFTLKGDEFQVIPFNLEILKRSGLEAFYITERTVEMAD